MRRWTIIAVILTLAALGLRLTLALGVAVDCSGDGPVYRQIALNLLDRGIYSAEGEAPFVPSLIRMPGYPLTLAGIFSLFGHDNLTAVHLVQALVDTATCWLAALLCGLWAPVSWEEGRRRAAALWAFALLAVCPFTAVYAGTTLTETWTLFFGTLSVAAGSWALRAPGPRALAVGERGVRRRRHLSLSPRFGASGGRHWASCSWGWARGRP